MTTKFYRIILCHQITIGRHHLNVYRINIYCSHAIKQSYQLKVRSIFVQNSVKMKSRCQSHRSCEPDKLSQFTSSRKKISAKQIVAQVFFVEVFAVISFTRGKKKSISLKKRNKFNKFRANYAELVFISDHKDLVPYCKKKRSQTQLTGSTT